MMRRLAQLGVLLAASTALAESERALESLSSLEPHHAGQLLAGRLRSAVPTENAEFKAVLTTRQRDGYINTVPIQCRIVTGETNWQVIYDAASTDKTPAERLLIVRTPGCPNEYWGARASTIGQAPGQPSRLNDEQAAAPLADSDFWLSDLGLDFFHWPGQRLLKTEMRKGRLCYVLESTHRQGTPSGYSRVVSWLDKETGGPLLAEGYDRENKLLKEFSIRSFRKVEGQWQLQEMEIRNLKTKTRTRLEFEFEKAP
jgi:hypothetical protein